MIFFSFFIFFNIIHYLFNRQTHNRVMISFNIFKKIFKQGTFRFPDRVKGGNVENGTCETQLAPNALHKMKRMLLSFSVSDSVFHFGFCRICCSFDEQNFTYVHMSNQTSWNFVWIFIYCQYFSVCFFFFRCFFLVWSSWLNTRPLFDHFVVYSDASFGGFSWFI